MRITQETKLQLGAGAAREVIALSLLQGETRKQTIQLTYNSAAIDLTGYVFDFKLIRRDASFISDTKNGFNIVGLKAYTGATEIDLSANLTVLNAVTGLAQIYFPASLTATEPTDPDSAKPVIYTGYLSINDGQTDALIQKITLLVLVSNDGV